MIACILSPGALQDAASAIEYLDESRPQSGAAFTADIQNAVDLIREQPLTWPKYLKKTRRIRLTHFPYALIYVVKNDCALIVAVAHLHRRPGYWTSRLRKL